ncbi:hypothetical protein GCM10022280_27470 [Sphingomonas swuensis]|uniref:Uncharacterized protein n=1 Tax=Sphingomonas swuensis TaxID=977800 RepID=A0ABP7TEI8_9SPHN
MRIELALIAAALLAGPASAAQEQPRTNEAAELSRQLGSGGLTGRKLAEAIAKAEAFPLGSKDNPVRANMPQGEQAYLRSLRCADGQAPEFMRSGSSGTGVYGYILDAYDVRCAGKDAVSVMIDMYHDHVERRPVPGFVVASAPPTPTS